ncbi:hypothetical protein [Streptomyces lichenis]|uniref:Uncharacterized protein n=1 Tax=Streptomyces lichenis TaxID=2306967 RepID=A0ABT0IFV0_9ACTN|nr:hypothetical protein [Streptomyces lichenis]MCK8680211.1 hypothetical protein [Streptomyces lichenis]
MDFFEVISAKDFSPRPCGSTTTKINPSVRQAHSRNTSITDEDFVTGYSDKERYAATIAKE